MAVKAVRVYCYYTETEIKPIKLGNSDGKLEINGLLKPENSNAQKERAIKLKNIDLCSIIIQQKYKKYLMNN